MSKPAGKCVFCGSAGVTKGHVWPDWLNKILPKTATHHEQVTGYFSTFTPEVPGPPKNRTLRQGHARSRKPRNTCGKCNGGWMSNIENEVIPWAAPLIVGQPITLTDEGQRKLAAFFCLISMRLEFLGALRAIPPSDRRSLMENGEPPPIWSVWIARYGGEKPDEQWSRYLAMQVGSTPADKVGPEHCNMQVTTLVIGQLCAHLYSSTVSPLLGYEGVQLTRIWPLSGFALDSRFLPVLSDETVTSLQEALARESKPLPKNLSHKNPPSRERKHT